MISVIIPCYKSAQTIQKVVELTAEELTRLNRTPFEFVLVDDGSPDGGACAAKLKELSQLYPYVKAVLLARNCGQHNAIMAALNYAQGDIMVNMDDDMQTHPSQLKVLLDELDKGYDVVYGYYPNKKHSGFRRLGSDFNSWTVRKLIGKPKSLKTSSFYVYRKFVRDYAIQYKLPYTHMQGIFLRITKNIGSVPIEHFEREVGTSGYTLKSLIRLWSNIIGYSVVPLRMAVWAGGIFSALGILGALFVVIRKLLVPAMAMGWPSMMCAICFFSGVNLLVMGLVGEYVGRMFLAQSNTPQFVVKEVCVHKSPGVF